jgi:molybdopterin-guanine dinucleotide biosynthesis protein A
MGRDKARLTFNTETFLQGLVRRMSPVFRELIIVADRPERYNHPPAHCVSDIFPAMGPLAGIHAGLSAAQHECAFVTACDMPFFDAGLAAFLLEQVEGHDAVVPCSGGFTEPLCAVYAKSAMTKMEGYLRSGRGSVNNFLDRVNTLYVPEQEIRRMANPDRVFFNMNTPGDYLRLLSEIPPGDVQAAPLRSIPSSSPRSSAIPRKSPMAE